MYMKVQPVSTVVYTKEFEYRLVLVWSLGLTDQLTSETMKEPRVLF